MYKRMILSAIAGLAMGAGAETFKIDTGHAEIGFAAKHMMVSNTKGKFNTFEGTLDYDIATKTLKSAQGTIDAASIDTNNEKRDEHLRNEDFFNTAKFPKITFRSTSVKKTGDNEFEVAGKLTVLGIDRDVVLPVTIIGPVEGRGGATLIGVECNTTLNRRALGIDHAPAAVIGDDVKISIELEAGYK
ncbi:YceI family protein [Pontiella sp.]|uniref:YceI family protein n=1 Tax=Pontiella sp. TaxID=2837462 RepID=UPI00356301D1